MLSTQDDDNRCDPSFQARFASDPRQSGIVVRVGDIQSRTGTPDGSIMAGRESRRSASVLARRKRAWSSLGGAARRLQADLQWKRYYSVDLPGSHCTGSLDSSCCNDDRMAPASCLMEERCRYRGRTQFSSVAAQFRYMLKVHVISK